jgi:hypothetical protein
MIPEGMVESGERKRTPAGSSGLNDSATKFLKSDAAEGEVQKANQTTAPVATAATIVTIFIARSSSYRDFLSRPVF